MRYAIQFGNKTMPIEENEVEKVIQAMEQKRVVVLSCGILNGAFIGGVIRDLHAERGLYYGYNVEEESYAKDYETDLPEKVKELKIGNNTKLLN